MGSGISHCCLLTPGALHISSGTFPHGKKISLSDVAEKNKEIPLKMHLQSAKPAQARFLLRPHPRKPAVSPRGARLCRCRVSAAARVPGGAAQGSGLRHAGVWRRSILAIHHHFHDNSGEGGHSSFCGEQAGSETPRPTAGDSGQQSPPWINYS